MNTPLPGSCFRLGSTLFAVSLAGLAALSLAFGDFAPLVDTPAGSPHAYAIAVYVLGSVLFAAAVGLLVSRTRLRSVVVIGVYLTVWLITRARPIFGSALTIGSFYGVSEASALLAGCGMLYVTLRQQTVRGESLGTTDERWLRVGRILFGLACLEFGAAHFAYASYTGSFVPSWFPAPMAFVYLTGGAHAAAGLGLVTGVFPRLAAKMEGTMIALFGLLVWVPSFFSHPRPAWAGTSQNQWSETLLTLLLAAAAWIVAGSPIAREKAAAGRSGLAVVGLALLTGLSAGAATAPDPYPLMAPLDRYLIADRNAEIALAKSSAPDAISRAATVLVLGRNGYETAIEGTNHFVCLVERSWMSPFDSPDFWNPKLRGPICYNPQAVQCILPYTINRTKLVLAGLSKAQLKERITLAVANGELPVPTPGAMSYMLSKEGYLGDAVGHWTPHLMFHTPKTDGANWGANVICSPVVLNDQFTDVPEPETIFMVPVGRWSDGTTAK